MRPIRFLYWNTGKKDGTQELVLTDLFKASGVVPDVLLLSECLIDLSAAFLQQHGLEKVTYAQPPGTKQTQIAYFKPQQGLKISYLASTSTNSSTGASVPKSAKAASRYITNSAFIARILLLTLEVDKKSTLVASVHLPSRRHGHQDEASQLGLASRYKSYIEEGSDLLSDFEKRIVVAGDFNMNPFDLGMVEPTGFFALNNRAFVRHIRKVDKVPELMFYNPSWAMMSDIVPTLMPIQTQPPPVPQVPPSTSPSIQPASLRISGSLYYAGTASKKLYWHLYDQVLLSKSLANNFDASELRIASYPHIEQEVMSRVSRAKAKYSDHLPLCFTLNLG